jgi:hypothetical protein
MGKRRNAYGGLVGETDKKYILKAEAPVGF